MGNKEINTRIRFVNGRGFRSIGERQIDEHTIIHCVAKAETAGEPISNVDFRLYRMALEQEGGVDKKDAKEVVKQLRKNYETGNPTQKRKLGEFLDDAWEGLTSSRWELVPVRQEVTVYSRKR